MIEFVHNGIKVKCKPERALEYKRAIDKPQKPRQVPERRSYPQWNPTMTTEDYLRAYIRLNDNKRMIECKHEVMSSAFKVPSMYDPAQPEVLEELDPDYVETVKVKSKPVTSAQLKAALKSLIEAIEHGDPETIANHTLKAKELLK